MIKLYCNTSDTDLVIGYVFSIVYNTRHKTEIIKFERPCNEDFSKGTQTSDISSRSQLIGKPT